MTRQQMAERLQEVAIEFTPHSKYVASVLCSLSASLLMNTEGKLSALTTSFSEQEIKRINEMRAQLNSRN